MTNQTPPKQRSLRREVTRQTAQRLKSEIASQRELVKSGLRSQLEGLVPAPLRWLIPVIESFRGEAGEPEVGEMLPESPAGQVEPTIAPSALYAPLCATHDPLTCPNAQGKQEGDQCGSCGFPLLLRVDEQIAGRRGRYRITGVLGERGIGRLYQATRVSDGAAVVIKEFLVSERLNPLERREKKAMFTRLAGIDSIDGKLSDYRLVAPWEAIADTNRDRCYLVTRGHWDAAPTLAAYLKQQGPMTDQQVRRVLDQVLQTLEFLHQIKARSPEGFVNEYGSAHGNLTLHSLLYIDRKAGGIPASSALSDLDFFIYVCDLAQWEFLFDITATYRDMYALAQAIGQKAKQIRDLQRQQAETQAALRKRQSEQLKQAATRAIPALEEAQHREFEHLKRQQAAYLAGIQQQAYQELKTLQKADLRSLGYVGYTLLTGKKVAPNAEPALALNHPRLRSAHPVLRQVIEQLVEGQIEDAIEARQQLRQMPIELGYEGSVIAAEAGEAPLRAPKWLWWLLGGTTLGLLLWLISSLLPKPQPQAIARSTTLTCGMEEVAGVPDGTFLYRTAERDLWSSFLRQNLLSRASDLSAACMRDPADNLNGKFEEILAARQKNFKLRHQFITDQSNRAAREQAIAQVRELKSAFTLTNYTADLSADLISQTIAHDGLAIIVSFSYAKRDNSLPKRLGGQIRMSDLQRLYTGQVRNWKELGGPDLPVSLYAPDDDAAIQMFEQKALQTPDNIRLFRQMLAPKPQQNRSFVQLGEISRLPIGGLLQQVIRDFENEQPQRGAIAFAPISRVFGQCSVYPLAITTEHHSVQPLVQTDGKPIDPNTDLCRNKGSYAPDSALFQRQVYPLAYDLAVVYRRDNRLPPVGEKFAEIMQTQEGQSLLKQSGLIPISDWNTRRRE